MESEDFAGVGVGVGVGFEYHPGVGVGVGVGKNCLTPTPKQKTQIEGLSINFANTYCSCFPVIYYVIDSLDNKI